MTVLTVVETGGSPREIGRAMGQFGAVAMRRLVLPGAYWARTVAFAGSDRVRAMETAARAALPWAVEEVEGLAEGLGLPFDAVFAWCCRGDLRAGAPEGCTTVMLPGTPNVIGHNEDGDPGEKGDCGLVVARPEGRPGFAAFLYPGSIPGTAFGVTEAGLVQTVNNVRCAVAPPGVPRMLLGRAIYGCRGLDEAVGLIRGVPRAGGFHFALAQAGDRRLLSVEFSGAAVSVQEVAQAEAHANHLVHGSMMGEAQTMTQSSADRQARADAILGQGALAVLQDQGGPGLPVFRDDPRDPDEENTVVQVLAEVGAARARLAIHDPGAAEAGLAVVAEAGRIRLE